MSMDGFGLVHSGLSWQVSVAVSRILSAKCLDGVMGSAILMMVTCSMKKGRLRKVSCSL